MNILWICTDQQRLDSLGCFGNRVIDTPNLDALSREGTKFNNCYSQSPVCSPSRGAFLTGRYPRTCGMRQNGASIREGEVLVTKMLADSGYVCGLAGKLHLNPCAPSVTKGSEKRIDDGYSVFHWSHDTGDVWQLNDYHLWLRQKGVKYQKYPYKDYKYIEEGMPIEHHQTTYCTEKAENFIRANEKFNNNWLFSVNYFDPHDPCDPPKELFEKYLKRLEQIPKPNYIEGELKNKPYYQRAEHEGKGGTHRSYEQMTEADHLRMRAAYYAMVELIDISVGRLIAALKETGQYDNTAIIFMSDHGEMMGDHGIYMKGPYLYEPAVHVPLIIRIPAAQKGIESNGLVELLDLPQTILDIAGLPHHAGMMGKSLYGICTGESDPSVHKDVVYSEYYNAMPWPGGPRPMCTMIFDGRYKLIATHSTNELELYDLKEQPCENYNLADNPSYEKVRTDMLLKMCNKMAFTCDPLSVRVSSW